MVNLQHYLNQAEIPVCIIFNRINHKHLFSRFFAVISRLGDGVFWYSLIVLLPFIYGSVAIITSFHMIVVAMLTFMIYRWLKLATHRIRPYQFSDNILQNVAALDQFSFPSGHTMHAVSFSYILLSYYPEWFWLVLPFTVLVALSRLVLGLHYPSDVLAGIITGLVISASSFIPLAYI